MSNVNVRCDHKKKLILKLKSAATLGFGFVMSFDKLCILVMTEGEDLMKEMMMAMMLVIIGMMMITVMRVVNGDGDIKHDNDGDDVKVCDWVCSLASWGRRRDLSLRSQPRHLLIPAITTDHKLSSINRRMGMRMLMLMILRRRILFIPLMFIDKHEDVLVQN